MDTNTNNEKKGDVFSWIFAITVGLLFYVINIFVDKIFKPFWAAPAEPKIDIYTTHNIFDAPKSKVFEDLSILENISEKYERMCLIDPIAYRNDPQISSVLEDYKSLLNGTIKDPKGQHIPTEFIDGSRNPDYLLYMKNQYKVLGLDWFKNEIHRIEGCKEEINIVDSFVDTLSDLGLDLQYLAVAVNEERINNFNADNWKSLVEKTKKYENAYGEKHTYLFLKYTTDEYLNDTSMETFNALMCQDLDIDLALKISNGNYTTEEILEIVRIKDEYSLSYKDAFDTFNAHKNIMHLENSCRSNYSSQVHRS